MDPPPLPRKLLDAVERRRNGRRHPVIPGVIATRDAAGVLALDAAGQHIAAGQPVISSRQPQWQSPGEADQAILIGDSDGAPDRGLPGTAGSAVAAQSDRPMPRLGYPPGH